MSTFLIALLTCCCLALMYELHKTRSKIREQIFTLDDIVKEKLKGEERGLLLGFAIVNQTIRFYSSNSGLGNTLQEKFHAEILSLQSQLGMRRKSVETMGVTLSSNMKRFP